MKKHYELIVSRIVRENSFISVDYQTSQSDHLDQRWKVLVGGRSTIPEDLIIICFLLNVMPSIYETTAEDIYIVTPSPLSFGSVQFFDHIFRVGRNSSKRLRFVRVSTNYSTMASSPEIPRIQDADTAEGVVSEFKPKGNPDLNHSLIAWFARAILDSVSCGAPALSVPLPGFAFWNTSHGNKRYQNGWLAEPGVLSSLSRALFSVFGIRLHLYNPLAELVDLAENRGLSRDLGILAQVSDDGGRLTSIAVELQKLYASRDTDDAILCVKAFPEFIVEILELDKKESSLRIDLIPFGAEIMVMQLEDLTNETGFKPHDSSTQEASQMHRIGDALHTRRGVANKGLVVHELPVWGRVDE